MSRRPETSPLADEAGSVFIEALISLALLAGILAAVYQVSAVSAARHRAIEARRQALMVARSVLASVGSAAPLAAGMSQGANNGEVWRVETARCGAPGDSAAGLLYCVTVSVGEPGGPALVTLVSRRLGPLA